MGWAVEPEGSKCHQWSKGINESHSQFPRTVPKGWIVGSGNYR